MRRTINGGKSNQEAASITFNSRIVFVDKVALNQLDGEARFTDATATDNDELVLSHELSGGQTLATEEALRWLAADGRVSLQAAEGGHGA